MFNVEITMEQKRWGHIPAPQQNIEYHTRTVVTGLAVEEGDKEGTVGVQKEMMLSAFPSGQSLVFKNGVLQDLYRESVQPYTVQKKVELYADSGLYLVFRATNDTTQQAAEIEGVFNDEPGDIFKEPWDITIDEFTVHGFNWRAGLGELVVISGTCLYTSMDEEDPGAEEGFILQSGGTSSGVQLRTEDSNGNPVSLASVWEVLDDPTYKIEMKAREKILFNGVWIPQSFEDEGSVKGVAVSFIDTNVRFTFGGTYDLDIPKSVLETGEWFELPDPTDPAIGYTNKRKSGVSVKFGFDGPAELAGDTAGIETSFYGQFLTGEDAVEELEDSFIFRRVMDITDLKGSVTRYSDLSSFYRTRRWVKQPSGVPVFMYLDETSPYEWKLFTGTVNTSQYPDLRAASAKTVYNDVEVADENAKAVVSMIRIFKSQYVSYINASFSTDTDEYPDKKQTIVV